MTTDSKRYKHSQRSAETAAEAGLKTREIRWANDTKRHISKLEDGTVIREGGHTTRYLERFTSLAAALTAFGSSDIEAMLSTTHTLSGNTTIPSNVKLRILKGGRIALNGFTLTVNGPIEAGVHQIFSGSGSVNWGPGAVSTVYPEWWGAKPDDSTDCTSAINSALRSLTATSTRGGEVFLSRGTYKITDTVFLPTDGKLTHGIRLYGASKRYSIIKLYNTGTSNALEFPTPGTDGYSGTDSFGGTWFDYLLENFTITTNSSGTSGGILNTSGLGTGAGLYLADANFVKVRNLFIQYFNNSGIVMVGGAYHNTIQGCNIQYNTRDGIEIVGTAINYVTHCLVQDTECIFNARNAVSVYKGAQMNFIDCTLHRAAFANTLGSATNLYEGNGLYFNNCTNCVVDRCWFEINGQRGILCRTSDNIHIQNCWVSSAGTYDGGGLAASPSDGIAFYSLNTDCSVRDCYFKVNNTNDIRVEAGETRILLSGNNNASGTMTIVDSAPDTVILTHTTTGGLNNSFAYRANKFYASSTYGYQLPGGDGAEYQLRVDSNKKMYRRRDADGISIAAGDMHYGGNTASRPASPLLYETYYDTTLGQMVQWDGAAWRNPFGITALARDAADTDPRTVLIDQGLLTAATQTQKTPGVMFTGTADKTVANDATEQGITPTGVGSSTIKSAYFRAGLTIRTRMRGYLSNTGTPTIRLKQKLGSTIVADTTAVTMSSVASSTEFEFVVDITIRTTGAGGTCRSQGYFRYGATIVPCSAQTADVTIDTTADKIISPSVQWGTASASNTITITNVTYEILN